MKYKTNQSRIFKQWCIWQGARYIRETAGGVQGGQTRLSSHLLLAVLLEEVWLLLLLLLLAFLLPPSPLTPPPAPTLSLSPSLSYFFCRCHNLTFLVLINQIKQDKNTLKTKKQDNQFLFSNVFVSFISRPKQTYRAFELQATFVLPIHFLLYIGW